MSTKGLKVVLPSAVTDAAGLRKLEHYYGIEFTRGASNQGGDNGYHKMIGDASLLKEMRFHNQMKIASVKDAEIQTILNQTNWRKTEDGANAVLDGTDGADIMQVHTKTVYAIIGGTNPTYERFIVSDQPFTYDGDVAKEYPAYGETPDYATMLNGVMRSIRNEGVTGTHGAGVGVGHTDPLFGTTEAGGYPRNSLSRFQYEQYARAKNADTNSNRPYMNICNQDLELTAAFMYIEFRTKQLNSLLGHSLSSISTPTAQTWGKVSGFRLTADNGATYRYHTFGTQMFINDSTVGSNMWTILNGSCPMLKMFEAQLAVSDGNASFESVKDSDGNPIAGIEQGVMTGIYTKTFTFNLNNAALTAGGEKQNWKVDVVMRVPLWRGRNRLWGHCTQWYSGYEFIQWLDGEEKLHHKAYRSPSIDALVSDSDVALYDSEGNYGFEKTYDCLGEMPVIVNKAGGGAWATKMFAVNGIATALTEVGGAGLSTYEQAHFYSSATDLVQGKFRRRGARFGGYATEANCVLRYASGYYAPSHARTFIGSGFRVEIND